MQIRPFPGSEGSGEKFVDTKQRICAAAMRCFAQHGTDAASLRMVADAASVSVGLVQHHFGTKAVLVKAVDDQLIDILRAAAPSPSPPEDTVADVGQRITMLIEQQSDAMDYLAHLLISDSPTGQAIFDALTDIGRAQWTELSVRGHVRSDLDPTWGPLNPLVLVLGTLILRSHIERQIPEPLTTPAQLRSWTNALNRLIRDGQLQHPSP